MQKPATTQNVANNKFDNTINDNTTTAHPKHINKKRTTASENTFTGNCNIVILKPHLLFGVRDRS